MKCKLFLSVKKSFKLFDTAGPIFSILSISARAPLAELITFSRLPKCTAKSRAVSSPTCNIPSAQRNFASGIFFLFFICAIKSNRRCRILWLSSLLRSEPSAGRILHLLYASPTGWAIFGHYKLFFFTCAHSSQHFHHLRNYIPCFFYHHRIPY